MYKTIIYQNTLSSITGHELYHKIKRYTLTEKELQENCFPRPDCIGKAKFYLSERTNNAYFASKYENIFL